MKSHSNLSKALAKSLQLKKHRTAPSTGMVKLLGNRSSLTPIFCASSCHPLQPSPFVPTDLASCLATTPPHHLAAMPKASPCLAWSLPYSAAPHRPSLLCPVSAARPRRIPYHSSLHPVLMPLAQSERGRRTGSGNVPDRCPPRLSCSLQMHNRLEAASSSLLDQWGYCNRTRESKLSGGTTPARGDRGDSNPKHEL